ncbi:NEQ035 [Nanoarchaeum equitans Kin4-M]|uniref:NEQ035 n=1 Tax=Nanoarchaeum equitans (strain Kin4-M) TaxID=228908 RepID=Q74N57_NANEQ|nr:NEQ035 [Nanoarchaeum equitans Kin4-M]
MKRFLPAVVVLGLALAAPTAQLEVIDYPNTVYTKGVMAKSTIPITIKYNTTDATNSKLIVYLINQNEKNLALMEEYKIDAGKTKIETIEIPLYNLPDYPNVDDGIYTIKFRLISFDNNGNTAADEKEINVSINEPFDVAQYDLDVLDLPLPEDKIVFTNTKTKFQIPIIYDGIANSDYVTVTLCAIANGIKLACNDTSKTLTTRENLVELVMNIPSFTGDGKLILSVKDNNGQNIVKEYAVKFVDGTLDVNVMPVSEKVMQGESTSIIVRVNNPIEKSRTVYLTIKTPTDTITKTIYLEGYSSAQLVIPIKVKTNSNKFNVYVYASDGVYTYSKQLTLDVVSKQDIINNIDVSYEKDKIELILYPKQPGVVTIKVLADGAIVDPSIKTISLDYKAKTVSFNYKPLKDTATIKFEVYDLNNNKIAEKQIKIVQKKAQQFNWLLPIAIIIALGLGLYLGRKKKEEIVE